MNDSMKSMIQDQIIDRGITDSRVLKAMAAVDRAHFVPEEYQARAYEDGPLPIGHNQTISQPYIVAFMTSAILPPSDVEVGTVLELGSGCGYQCAVLAQIFPRVIGFERVPELVHRARRNLETLGIENVEIQSGDGSGGIPGQAFQAILAAASFTDYPTHLEGQLLPGGKMVLPAGQQSQYLYLVENTPQGIYRKRILAVRFVPMISD